MKIKNMLKGLIVGLAMMVSASAFAGSGADGWNGRDLTDGLVISFCGSNDKFLSSENGSITMRCNRTSAGAWEKFTVEVVTASPKRVRLVASNGKYVRVLSSGANMKADAVTTGDATLFTSDSNSNSAGQHTLAENGTFLSSENGTIPVRVNRSSVGAWERWDIQAY